MMCTGDEYRSRGQSRDEQHTFNTMDFALPSTRCDSTSLLAQSNKQRTGMEAAVALRGKRVAGKCATTMPGIKIQFDYAFSTPE